MFFLARGFDQRRPEALEAALRSHALTHAVSGTETTPLGVRYRIEAPMACPDGSSPGMRTIWFVRTGESNPRFVTAYPLKRRPPER